MAKMSEIQVAEISVNIITKDIQQREAYLKEYTKKLDDLKAELVWANERLAKVKPVGHDHDST